MKKYFIGTILVTAFIVLIVGGFNSLMNKNAKLAKDNTVLSTQVDELGKANEFLNEQINIQKQIGKNNTQAVSSLSKKVIKNNNDSNRKINTLKEKTNAVDLLNKNEEEKALEVSMLVFDSIQRQNKIVETQKVNS
jgi:hypothetical protein